MNEILEWLLFFVGLVLVLMFVNSAGKKARFRRNYNQAKSLDVDLTEIKNPDEMDETIPGKVWIGFKIIWFVAFWGILSIAVIKNIFTDESLAMHSVTLGLGSVLMSALIGFLLFRLIGGKKAVLDSIGYARVWSAWTILAATVGVLPQFILNPGLNNLFKWLVPAIIFGIMAFLFGWLYGKFIKSSDNKSTKLPTLQDNIAPGNRMLMERVLLVIAACMLLMAVLDMPIIYYTALRVVVFLASGFAAYYFFEKQDGLNGIVFVLMSVLWNPVFPIWLYNKPLWIVLDIVAAIYMFIVSRRVI